MLETATLLQSLSEIGHQQGWSPSTAESYRRMARLFLASHPNLADLTRRQAQSAFLALSFTKSPSWQKQMLAAIRVPP
jgi:hypothetical protein